MNPRMQKLQSTIRRAHLLGPLEKVRQWGDQLMHLPANRRFRKEHPDFPTPPADIAFDAHGTVNWPWFASSGRARAEQIAGFIERHVDVPAPAVLEWGCGGARILRHLPDLLPEGSTVAGSDYNRETIAWCKANLPGIRFEENALEPPLRFDDSSFDFVFAISVLTHLSEPMQHAWVKELGRVIKPGGVVLLSVKGQSFAPIILEEERPTWDAGSLVIRADVTEGKRMFSAFHPERFMRDELLAGFEVVEHVPSTDLKTQDIWVARVRG